ncbi:MAG: hypothetical protein QM747_11695 [Nocardioides sp.]
MPSRAPRQTRSRALAVVALASLSVALGGCGGGSSSPSSSSSGDADSGGAQTVASTVTLGRVAGDLHQPNKRIFAHHRRQLLDQVGHAVGTWIDGGFVGVSYPRDSFDAAFSAFTGPAAKEAQHQQQLMTNWDLRQQIDGVKVTKRSVKVDVLAPHGRPAGATARVALVFTTTGDVTKRVTVHGRLFLSPDDSGDWKIFGFDVAKGGQ